MSDAEPSGNVEVDASDYLALGRVSTDPLEAFRVMGPSEVEPHASWPLQWVLQAHWQLWLDVQKARFNADALVQLNERLDEKGRAALPKVVFEAMFETVRLAIHPRAPSRLVAKYGCPDHHSAQQFLDTHVSEGERDKASVVRVVTDGPWIAADMNLFEAYNIGTTPASALAALQEAEQRANAYWSGQCSESAAIEILAWRLRRRDTEGEATATEIGPSESIDP